ncbi:hypothetical protein CAEBREN_01224 [Caenorhabditis brenneri]|uniref:F-box domain-containing protein n=1 Tax=Caenorhabditis brenneri TaxID=135651 RepID=G0P3T8_CAEBE|nr:hypothetical protein CAEBREN_01224 [Caenorhabditis brenneri]
MAFPLFRLPLLVVKLILETMGFIEMFVLTRTSSKTKRVFERLVTIRNHELILFLESTGFVFDLQTKSGVAVGCQIFLRPTENQPDDVFMLKIGSTDVASALTNKNGRIILSIYSDTCMYTETQLVNALREVFRMPLQEMEMRLDNVAVETYHSWITWNNTMFYDIPGLHFAGKCSFSAYIWILKHVRTRHVLNFVLEPTEYENNAEIFEIQTDEEIFIDHGRWINDAAQLNSIKARNITIRDVSLSDTEINTFLKNWRDSGVASGWKQLDIHFNGEADLDVVLEGIDGTDEDLNLPAGVIHQFDFNSTNGEKCTVYYVLNNPDALIFGFEFHFGN